MNTFERQCDSAEVRRWHPPDVAGARPARGQVSGGAAVLTAERLAEIEEQARSEGYRRGLDEGRKAGRAELRESAQRLDRVLSAIAPQAAVLDEPMLIQLGELVMAVARQLIRRELRREPGEVVRVVREALSVLPVSDATIRIHLHPDDAALVREVLAPDTLERPIRVLEDITLARGGARVETDVSSVDASVESRLNAIAASLFGDERDRTARRDAESDQ